MLEFSEEKEKERYQRGAMNVAWENQDGRSGVQGLVMCEDIEIMYRLETRVGTKVHSTIVKPEIILVKWRIWVQ